MFGYLGNEYSGKLKFNVGRNSSNARGSSSGICSLCAPAPKVYLLIACSHEVRKLEINSQGIWNLTLAKTVPMPQGAPEFCSLFCHRVKLLALCGVNSWSINCTIEAVWKTNNGSTILFEAENSVPKVDCCFHAILFVHLSYFPYFCIHFLVQIWVSCIKEILLAVTWACWKCVSNAVCIIMALSQQIGIQLECQSCDQWGRSRGARGENEEKYEFKFLLLQSIDGHCSLHFHK